MTEIGSSVVAETCAQCGKTLSTGDRVASGDKVFCGSCYASLRAELEHAVGSMSTDIPWAKAAAGAVLGGAAGALAWWGFTVITHVALGLIAVAIGFLTGQGVVRFSGGKRSAGLQGLSVAVAVLSFFFATYLVNMTLINKMLAEKGTPGHVPFPPTSPDMFLRVISAGFGVMDLVFLAIAIYEAWKIPRPVKLPRAPA
ncbi:MAG TPA: hypothetical protein VFV19_10280 [Candidatus Polarisedimenticolaceae bacterium]|nr:hypothetical protein [Candidatus Polarisedimenticolaceae bacterium]